MRIIIFWVVFMKLLVSVLTPALVVGASVVQAEQAQESAKMEQVLVWGTKVKSSSVYMGAEDLEIKQADHISDLLRVIPGVDVGGAHSLNQRITIRSIEDRDIKISIDGANQNNYMYHHMGNLQIHADILQAVDIDVGTNSVVHGGLGGSVRFETKTARELLQGSANLGAIVKGTVSTNASDDLALSAFGENNGLDFLAYYNRVEKKNFEVGGGEIKDADGGVIEGTDGEVRGLEGTVDSMLLKGGWQLAPRQRLELGYESYKDEGDYSYRPDMGLATDISIADGTNTPLTYPTEYTRDTLTLNYDGQVGATSIKTSLYDNSSTLWRDETANAESTNPFIQAGAGIIEGGADNYGVNVIAISSLNATHQLTYGGEIVHYDTDYAAQLVAGGSSSGSEKKTDHSLYVQDKITVGERFFLTPGVRLDNVDIESHVVDDHFTESSLALAFEFQPNSAWALRASTTELFQAPELAEVFIGAGVNDSPNQQIKAETGLNSELAFAYGASLAGADQFSAGATLFRTQIDNYIYDYAAPDPAAPRVTLKDNIGDMQVEGIEAYLGYELDSWQALISYSVNDSELDANGDYGHYDGARLDRVQGDTLTLQLDYDVASLNLKLHWDVQIVHDLEAVEANLQLDGAGSDNSKPGFSVHNISALWHPRERLNIIFGVDNVFDEYYVSQSSRTGSTFHPVFGSLQLNDYEPGRNLKATLSYQL